jgi:hypothetical protein
MGQQESVQICRGFTVEQWRRLKEQLVQNDRLKDDDAPWRCAIRVFERRIRERFLLCIEVLQESDPRADVRVPDDARADCSTIPDDSEQAMVPGFAIMALSCLLLETLESFYRTPGDAGALDPPCGFPDGPCIRPQGTTMALVKFLRRPAFKGAFGDLKVAADFANGIRNGIFHDAETRKWLIRRERPAGQIIGQEGERRIVNRTAFYKALKAEFEDYLRELQNKQNTELRKAFIRKMDQLVDKC